jgi:hypothetical protein
MAAVALDATPEKQRELSEVVEQTMLLSVRMYGDRLIALANLLEAEQEAARAERKAQAAQEQSAPAAKHNGHASANAATA